MIVIDAYHPLVSTDHEASCAALCTDYNPEDPEHDGCPYIHRCWCPDGGLSYAEFNVKHPDVTAAEV